MPSPLQNLPALTEKKQDSRRLISPTAFNQLIPLISARMVKASADELDAEILGSLMKVLTLLGVDRGGLAEVREDSPYVNISHGWNADGVDPVSAKINLAELLPWSYQRLVVLGQVRAMAKVEDLPPEADVDRQTYLVMAVKSALAIPLFIGSRVHHLIFVQALKSPRAWPDEIITYLRLLGEIFVSALYRREAEWALRGANERLSLSADSANAGLWELDIDSGQFWTTEKALELFGIAAEKELNFTRFLELVHADDRQSIKDLIEKAVSTRRVVSVQYRVSAAKGKIRWMTSRGKVQNDVKDGKLRFLGVTLEITTQKQVENRLAEQVSEIDRLRARLETENTFLRNELSLRQDGPNLLGTSSCMLALMSQLELVANTGSTVLIQGETGTGKELVAQTLHRLSDRGKRPMVKVNCAALPVALVESELFGREKGAYTGALSRQVGRFELAEGSSLFLDEIAEMPLETQVKLLRVLQEGELERLGSPHTIKVDVRVIAASNRDLAAEVAAGRFRRDLFYRLNIFPLQVPPLRERTSDIPQLVWEFVNELGERMGKKIRHIAKHDMDMLQSYSWPGNVRELRNVIERALIVSQGEKLELPFLIAGAPPASARVNLGGLASAGRSPADASDRVTLEDVERQHIQSILRTTGGRIKGAGGAAELLGLNPSTLYSRMRKLGIKTSRI